MKNENKTIMNISYQNITRSKKSLAELLIWGRIGALCSLVIEAHGWPDLCRSWLSFRGSQWSLEFLILLAFEALFVDWKKRSFGGLFGQGGWRGSLLLIFRRYEAVGSLALFGAEAVWVLLLSLVSHLVVGLVLLFRFGCGLWWDFGAGYQVVWWLILGEVEPMRH